MTSPRWDETWHRLREWTNGQAPSERLSAQILIAEGYTSVDPSHPLGGRDGGKDAKCLKDGLVWIMGAYFPRGQHSFKEIKKKFRYDTKDLKTTGATGFVFVTNQELTLDERKQLTALLNGIKLELYHLERITAILDSPALADVRKQFLDIDYTDSDVVQKVSQISDELIATKEHLEGIQTGGNTFCYVMLYDFDMESCIAQNFVLIRKGKFPLYDLRISIMDMDRSDDIFRKTWGELNSPADYMFVKWPLLPSTYYRIRFHARNGYWHQDLILLRSDKAQCWLAATKVIGSNGRDVIFQHIDNEFNEFGPPIWRS